VLAEVFVMTAPLLCFYNAVMNSYKMVYVKSLDYVMHDWKNIKEDADKKNQIFAFLLYSAQSEGILEYVKKYSEDICALAGRSCKIFMIVHPPEGYKIHNRKWFEKFNHGTDAR
jgi:hypothetical protein